ncbi:DUF1691-domain-containing protein [Trichoderma citrinoviride]|uniref:DUF1691-domain-containing protein n=1 Tax=Trichoderma citrinoviride TaxID=58853 RepID=A0A2T4BLS2_9HYPO|nr:DUF1691-domain-containing protein [Trichoderma citrinoviride]PTB70256.1 DUF1691-domain-containing protein [Trichoderma citrinoviride]
MESDSDAESPRGWRERRNSTLTAISLLQLDPAPMEDSDPDTPTEEKKPIDPLAADAAFEGGAGSIKTGSTMAPGLSGSGRGAIYYLTRLQKYSSYAMSVFTTMHLANVSLIPAVTRSVAGSETYLLMARELYQTTITEPLLVGLPVLTHIGSGIALRLLRRSENIRRYGGATPGFYPMMRSRTDASGASSRSSVQLWPPLSWISWSGYVFTAFWGAHVCINRVLPLAVEGDSSNIGLAYVSHGFARHPLVAAFAYRGLIGVGCGHMVWGLAKWLGIAPSTKGWWGSEAVTVDRKTKRQRRRRWLAIQAAVVAASALWAVGGLGVVARAGPSDGWVGKLYDDLFARVQVL